MTASEGLSVGTGTVLSLERSFHIMSAMTTTLIKIKAGTKSFLTPSVTVISLEVNGFLPGIAFSVVGRPSSMFASSERTSLALRYLLSLSFSRHLRITQLSSSEICSLYSLGFLGVSVFCLTATFNAVLPSKGTLPVSIS